jgi:hypothetical protein
MCGSLVDTRMAGGRQITLNVVVSRVSLMFATPM